MYENETELLSELPCAFDLTAAATDGSNSSNVVQGAISTAFHLVVFEIVCCIAGIPLNVKVSFSILRSRRKCRRPRNILLLAVLFTNFSSFARSIIDICYHFWPADSTCKAYVAFSVLPDAFLLMASFFSLMDRYLAISCPLWHRDKVTVPLVISVVAFGFVIQTAILKFMYIGQMLPLSSQVIPLVGTVNFWSLVVPFFLCLAARITVYIQTNRILTEHDGIADSNATQVVIYSTGRTNRPSRNRTTVRIQLGPRLSQRTKNRLEAEATKVLVIGVTSLLLISFPLVVFLFGITICHNWFNNVDYCRDTFGWLVPYLKQFGQVHGVYHPIIHMVWNKEFSTC